MNTLEAIPLNFEQCKQKLLPRQLDAHKGDFGHVLVIGGSPGFSGAARLAGEAALYTGAGLVSIATHPEHAAILNIGRPELMCHGIQNAKALIPLLDRANVILIGPGLGQNAWGKMCWNQVIRSSKRSSKPLILDADALHLLAQHPGQNAHWILTPHPGEAASLSITQNTKEIQKDRIAAIKKLQENYGGVIVLKGAHSLITDGKNIFVNVYQNPAMATAGMGDVLSGIIAGLVAQGLTLIDAANLGVATHSAAAQKITEASNPYVILAGELSVLIPQLLG